MKIEKTIFNLEQNLGQSFESSICAPFFSSRSLIGCSLFLLFLVDSIHSFPIYSNEQGSLEICTLPCIRVSPLFLLTPFHVFKAILMNNKYAENGLEHALRTDEETGNT